LTDAVTVQTANPLNLQLQIDDFKSHGKCLESSPGCPPQDNFLTPTDRTIQLVSFVRNGEDNRIALILCFNIIVAYNTESMIQNARGHASPFVNRKSWSIPFWGFMSIFSTRKVRIKRMNLRKHLNVMDHITSGILPATIKYPGSPLGFQTVKEALCNSIVPAIAIKSVIDCDSMH
jgi:hypothetical protein